MCLSAAYVEDDNGRQLIMDKVAIMRQDDDVVTFEDLLGRTASVKGLIASVDLLENVIVCKCTVAG